MGPAERGGFVSVRARRGPAGPLAGRNARARPSAKREVSARTPRANPLRMRVFRVLGAARCARALPEPCPICARSVPERESQAPDNSLGAGAEVSGMTDLSAPATELLTADDVAAMLGMTAGWVYEQSRLGRIPTVFLGRYRRYRREAIEQWLLELEAGGVRESSPRRTAA